MRYNRYAMPVDPRVLQEDFKSSRGTMKDIQELLRILKGVSTAHNLQKAELTFIKTTIRKLWYSVNFKKGINLADRENLYPVFREMNRVFKGKKTVPALYRGVKMPKFAPMGLSENDPGAKEILEGLAYGLRSWSSNKQMAIDWATGVADDTQASSKDRDKVVFKISGASVVLDCNAVLNFYYENYFRGISVNDFFLDGDEYILKLEEPEVIGIEHIKDDLYQVSVSD